MLSDSILEELVRSTALQKDLVTLTWPDLSVESKLQLIHAIMSRGHGWTPDWLLDLAQAEKAGSVRYWASRGVDFAAALREPRETPFGTIGRPVTAENRERSAKAKSDPEWLVRAAAEERDTLMLSTLSAAAQPVRLASIRALHMPMLGTFIEWLSKAVDEGIDDADLRDCAYEFFQHPHVKEELAGEESTGELDVDYDAGKAVETGWAVCAKAGPCLNTVLPYILPTSRGTHTMAVKELIRLPDRAIKALVSRVDSEEAEQLRGYIAEHRADFSEEVVKAVDSASDYRPSTKAERDRFAMASAADRSKVTLDAILDLRDGVRLLADRVQQLETTNAKKRGFFG